MNEQFCNYEISKKLKELKFNELCLAYFHIPTSQFYLSEVGEQLEACNNLKLAGCYIAAPLWQQVIDWLREKHSLIIETYYNFEAKKFEWQIDDVLNENDIDDETCTQFVNYYEVRERAILKALEIIK